MSFVRNEIKLADACITIYTEINQLLRNVDKTNLFIFIALYIYNRDIAKFSYTREQIGSTLHSIVVNWILSGLMPGTWICLCNIRNWLLLPSDAVDISKSEADVCSQLNQEKLIFFLNWRF